MEHGGRCEHDQCMRHFGRALDAAPPCLYVCVYAHLRAYVPHIRNEPLSIGVDRVWSARRRFTMRRRSTRTSARGTPPAWSTWPGYAPSPMKRCGQALGRGSTRRSHACGDTSCVCDAHARVCACVCVCTCIRTHIHECPYVRMCYVIYHLYLDMGLCVCTAKRTYGGTRNHVYARACLCVCLRTCACVRLGAHTQTHTRTHMCLR